MKHGDSVFLLLGNDNYLKEKAIKDISSSLIDNASKDLDYRVFYAKDLELGDILGYITTAPFASSRRFAVIKDFEKVPSDSKDRIISYIGKPFKTTCLVLEAKNESVLRELGDAVDRVTVKRCDEPRGQELRSWIARFMDLRKKKISQEAVSDLIELQGGCLSSLCQELEKLAAFSGERAHVTAEDVRAVVGRSITVSAFDLIAAIDKKDVNGAMKVAGDLILAGRRHHEIVGLLCWYMKRIIRAKAMNAKGRTRDEIASALKISRRNSDAFFRQVNGITDSQAKDRMSVLLETDLDIKRTRIDPTLVLEFAIIRLCLNGAR